MAFVFFLVACVFMIIGEFARGQTAEGDPIHVEGQHLIDSLGRVALFHGLANDNNYALPSATAEDMFLMNQWGFNVVRLGFHWFLVETTPGVYDQNYLDGLETLINEYSANGIHVILDMHQDCWSTIYCGMHGIPSFYAGPANTSEFAHNGTKAYPLPVAKPEYDPQGDITNCDQVASSIFGWASSYVTYALSNAAQRLYDNDDGILDRYGDFWEMIAARFSNNSYVLGYEILNEPWLGDCFADPSLFLPGEADRKNLARMNSYIASRIREVEPFKVLFFEPATGGNLLDATPVGYTSLPDTGSALSYHIYCPLLESDMPYHPHNESLWAWLVEAASLGACDLLNTYQYDTRHNDTIRLNVPGFMTEFGAILSNNTFSLDVIRLATEKMDSFFHSWTYWYETPSHPDESAIIDIIVRPYAQRVAGTPIAMVFDPTSRHFALTLAPSTNQTTFNSPTLIYLPPHYYPNGVIVSSEPNNVFNATFDYDTSTLSAITVSSAAQYDSVLLLLTPR